MIPSQKMRRKADYRTEHVNAVSTITAILRFRRMQQRSSSMMTVHYTLRRKQNVHQLNR